MKKRLYIDGMNVIRTNVPLAAVEERKGVRAAQKEFLLLADRTASSRIPDEEWIVVFDGPGEADAYDYGVIHVRHGNGVSADEIIVEAATGAVGMGVETIIVSADAEVRAPGAFVVDPLDFYDLLTHREPAAGQTAGSDARAKQLVESLAEAGRVDEDAVSDRELLKEIAARLEYDATRGLPVQKMAKKIEDILTNRTATHPNPDPQKLLFRALKDFFQAGR